MKNGKLLLISIVLVIAFFTGGLVFWDYYSFRNNLVNYIKIGNYEKTENLLKSRKFYSLNFYVDDKEKKQYYTPLFLSVMQEYPTHKNAFQITRLLLENGADPKLNNKSRGKIEYLGEIEDEDFLMEYSIICFILDHYNSKGNYNMEKEILENLLITGADADLCFKCNGKPNNSPLLVAAIQGNLDFMKLFIKYKANINLRDVYTFTRITERNFDVLFFSLLTKHFPDNETRFEAIRLIFENGFKLDLGKKYLLGKNKKLTIKEILSEKQFQPELVKYLEEKIAEAEKRNTK